MDLRDLYQEVILDHSKNPRNFGHREPHNREARGNNPLCGDKLEVHLEVEDGKVVDATFEGSGCAISTASASLMTELVRGKTEEDARRLFRRFHQLVTGGEAAHGEGEDTDEEAMDRLTVFAGVREFPMRVKCATLSWHTLVAALDDTGGKTEITTE